jgi:hypothetical protein
MMGRIQIRINVKSRIRIRNKNEPDRQDGCELSPARLGLVFVPEELLARKASPVVQLSMRQHTLTKNTQ